MRRLLRRLGDRIRTLRQVWTQVRTIDRRLGWWVLLAAVLGIAVGVGIGWLSSPWLAAPLGILTGLLVALATFNLRARRASFRMLEGQVGAAAAVLQQLRGAWFVTPAVGVTAKQDLVHRVVGPPGVVLVGEGAPQRVQGMLAQERRRLAKAMPDLAITTVVVGTGEDEVALARLQRHLTRLPRRVRRRDVAKLERRLKPLTRSLPIPGGIDPTAARRGRPKPR
jgi:hypothetical protein